MDFTSLPQDVKRIIYEYDDTYVKFFQSCIKEIEFLQNTFPIKLHSIITDNDDVRVISTVPTSKINKLNTFIFDYCKRKKSLRSYRNYKHFT